MEVVILNNQRLVLPSVAKRIVQEHDFRLRKSLGQNFLIDENILAKIVAAAELSSRDRVLEIGPGLGTMTQAMAGQAGHVTSIEIDKMLIPILQENLGDYPNVQIVHADALETEFEQLLPGDQPVKVVANLPYYITTPLILKLLTMKVPCSLMVFLVQKEVGERLEAKPGGKEYGSLTVFAQALSEVDIVTKVPKGVFMPPPKVDSVVVRLRPRSPEQIGIIDMKLFELTNRAIFGQRRKTLANALANSPHWELSAEHIHQALNHLGIDPKRRGETLSVAEIIQLSNTIAANKQA